MRRRRMRDAMLRRTMLMKIQNCVRQKKAKREREERQHSAKVLTRVGKKRAVQLAKSSSVDHEASATPIPEGACLSLAKLLPDTQKKPAPVLGDGRLLGAADDAAATIQARARGRIVRREAAESSPRERVGFGSGQTRFLPQTEELTEAHVYISREAAMTVSYTHLTLPTTPYV